MEQREEEREEIGMGKSTDSRIVRHCVCVSVSVCVYVCVCVCLYVCVFVVVWWGKWTDLHRV